MIDKDPHFISVIIPSTGRSTLSETKDALNRQTRPPDEVVVVFDKNRKGPSWARNEGFAKTKGDLVAFTDDDCIPGEDWLERMAAAIDKYDAAMVSSHYLETDPFLQEIRLRRRFPTEDRINPDGFVGNTGNVIYRRSCLEECLNVDGFIFNPVFKTYGCEDIDLVFRLQRRGHKVVFIDNRIKHLKKMTPVKYLRHQFSRGIGIGILYGTQKPFKPEQAPDKSLLWDEKKTGRRAGKWLLMIWRKVFGPFDGQSFSTVRHFLVFWLGEKTQALGFLYALAVKYKKRHPISMMTDK